MPKTKTRAQAPSTNPLKESPTTNQPHRSNRSSNTLPTRPVTAISFSVGSSVLRVPPSELSTLRNLISTARHLTRDVLGNALSHLHLRNPGFIEAVFLLSDLRGVEAASPRHVLHAYAALRALAVVRSPIVRQRAVEEILWLVFQAASGGRGSTRVRWGRWQTFVTKIGQAVGGVNALGQDSGQIKRLRTAWKKASPVSDVWAGAVSYETIVRMSEKFDAGFVEQLCAIGFVWTHAVVSIGLAEHEGGRLPVWRGELDSQFLSEFVNRIIKGSEYITDPRIVRQGEIDGEDDESFISRSFMSLRQFGHSFRSTSSSKNFTIDFQEDVKFPEKEVASFSTTSKNTTALVRRSRNAKPGKSPFHIDYRNITIGKLIGTGGYGDVYRGTYLMSPVAVKTFHINLDEKVSSELKKDDDDDDQDQDPNALNRMSTKTILQRFSSVSSQSKYDSFVKEVEMMSVVRHPNLVLYMGACGNPSSPLCIISELFTGGSLYDYLHKDEDWRPCLSIAIDFALNIARGMYYLHSSQPAILHRDLKSRNVLLSGRKSDGAAPHVVICDFGLSQLFDNDITKSGLQKCDAQAAAMGETVTMDQMGTASYMAPNIINGDSFEACDDVYSFGILMHEIFTGSIPYKGKRSMQVIYQVSCDDLRPSDEYDEKLPTSVIKLIRDCWHSDKLRRPLFEKIIKRLIAIEAEIANNEQA